MKPSLALLALLALAMPADAAEVSGVVYAMDGSVLQGATVRAAGATVTTADDGAFAFRGLPDGVVELQVEAKGFASAEPLVVAGDFVTVTLLEPIRVDGTPMRMRPPLERRAEPASGSTSVRGVVTVDGKPLANAPVIVQSFSEAMQPVRVRTNAKGVYVAAGLPALRYAVNLDDRLAARFRPARASSMAEGRASIADLRSTREGTVDLELRAAPVIRGRVVDREGTPVPRALVQLVNAERSTLDAAFDPAASRTAPDGRFRFPAPEWSESTSVTVAVTPVLHSTVRSGSFALGATDHDVTVTLPKLETVRIRVRTRAGEPIPQARFAFASTTDLQTFEDVTMLVAPGFAQRAPRADAAGELLLQLAPDSYELAAGAEGFQITTLSVKTTAKPATIDMTLDRAATLSGRVHRSGRGVANVHVMIVGGGPSPKERPSRSARNTTSTKADGTFEIEGLAPGTYRIGVFKQDELIDLSVDAEAPGRVDVALPPAGTLRARILDGSTGQPVREFVFSVEPVDGERNGRRSGVHRGESSADGSVALELPAGTYRVTAGARGFTTSEPAEARIVENETTNVDVPLGRGVTITGRVTDDKGVPIADADVLMLPAEPPNAATRTTTRVGPAHTQTGEDGAFTLTGIEPGEGQVQVRKGGYVPFLRRVDASGPSAIDVTLTRGLSIEGVVTRGGKPVAGAQVGASTAAIGGDHQSTATDEEGRFVLSGLIAARYTVSAFLEEDHAEVPDVDPTRRKTVSISLDPKPEGVVYGMVNGIAPAVANGPFARRTVMIQGTDRGAEAEIDDAGNYRIENAPTGHVGIFAHVESSSRSQSSARRQIEVLPGQPLRVDLDLSGNVRVSGRVTYEGRPAPGARIGFATDEGTSATTVAGEDGRFELQLPSPGLYRIFARVDELTDRHFQAVREIRGGETIDIDVREQVIEGTVVDAITRLPIVGAIVTLAPASGPLMSVSGEAPTDASGRFRIAAATSGSHRLIATAAGYAHKAFPLSGFASRYTFELVPVETLRVRVLDARNRTPLDAHLVVTETDGTSIPARPSRSGDGTTYTLSLAPGRYLLTAIVHGYTSRTTEVTAPGAVDVSLE